MARGIRELTAKEAMGFLRASVQPRALDPSHVVYLATNPTSVFHHLVEWDDEAAAEQWRLEQAARLIEEL